MGSSLSYAWVRRSAEREAGQTESVIRAQLEGALDGLASDELYELVIAYEPVWAIGTGQVCDADEANRVCGFIRQTLREMYDAEMAEFVRILYGGSVKASNAHALLHQPEIDGALVGSASLSMLRSSSRLATVRRSR
jgi:triosephosphate isomerase